LILKPLKYNDLISSFNKKNQNLTDLLAWAHESTITELIAKRTSAEGVLVDQFTKNQKVKARLHARKVRQEVLERTGAERDVAVAAASILARYQFLMARESMNRFYKMTLPLGASKEVDKAAKAFVSQYGIGRLGEVAKLHFKNTERLRITP
jgi:ribonuclease HIII